MYSFKTILNVVSDIVASAKMFLKKDLNKIPSENNFKGNILINSEIRLTDNTHSTKGTCSFRIKFYSATLVII